MASEKHKPIELVFEDRYPLHRGPFLFGPGFLTVESWYPSFHELIVQVLDQVNVSARISRSAEWDGRQALVEFSGVEMVIDGDGGLFWVDSLGMRNVEFDATTEEDWTGPAGAPDVFFRELDTEENIGRLGPDYRDVRKFSHRLFLKMRHRFESSLASGAAMITAMVGSEFVARSLLEPWQTRYLTIKEIERESWFTDDRTLDEAVGRDGTKLFGLAVVPESASARPVVHPISRSAKGKRGRKPTIDHQRLSEVMLDLMRKRGVPDSRTPNWTGEIFAKQVKAKLGVGRTTILENLPPVIERYRKELQHKGFRQSANSKTTVN